jgi:hypothetical protein
MPVRRRLGGSSYGADILKSLVISNRRMNNRSLFGGTCLWNRTHKFLAMELESLRTRVS